MRDGTGASEDRNVWGERNLSEEMELERNPPPGSAGILPAPGRVWLLPNPAGVQEGSPTGSAGILPAPACPAEAQGAEGEDSRRASVGSVEPCHLPGRTLECGDSFAAGYLRFVEVPLCGGAALAAVGGLYR
jgi:hypothetical protein